MVNCEIKDCILNVYLTIDEYISLFQMHSHPLMKTVFHVEKTVIDNTNNNVEKPAIKIVEKPVIKNTTNNNNAHKVNTNKILSRIKNLEKLISKLHN
jgi:hypothetical protein